MVRYNEEYLAQRGLRNVISNPNKSEEVKEVARRVLADKELFDEYVLLKRKRLEAIQRKKVREERKKNLTGWKKWCIYLLPNNIFFW